MVQYFESTDFLNKQDWKVFQPHPAVTYAAAQHQGRLFWITCKWLKLLKKAGRLQLIQNSAPSVAGRRQCCIRIDWFWCLKPNLFLNSRTLSRSHSADPHSTMPVCLQEYFIHCVSTKRGRILWSFLHPIWLAICCHFCYLGFDWCIWSRKIYETRTLQIYTKRKWIYDWICKSWVPSSSLEHNCGSTRKSLDVTSWNSSKPSKGRRFVQI